MRLSGAKLREKLCQLMDLIFSNRIPVEIERKVRIPGLVPREPKSKLMNLEPNDMIVGGPKNIINID